MDAERDNGLLNGDEPAQLSPEDFVSEVTQAGNLVPDIPDDKLATLAAQVQQDYDADKGSMSDWLESMRKSIELAKMVKKEKDYPFKGASNVMYPLITTAALQFNARAYQALVPAEGVVKVSVGGKDEGGTKAARGDRVSSHMSRQLLTEIEEWEDTLDRLLVVLPIVGEAQRKWWYDAEADRVKCRLIEPGKVIVNTRAQTKRDAPRCSEEIDLYPFEVESRIRGGTFAEFDYSAADVDKQAPIEFIEQHTRFDLDDDGYPEPYVATMHKDSGKLVRIVADFRPDDVRYVTETMMQQNVVPIPVAVDVMGQPIMGQGIEEVPVEVPVAIKSIRRGTYFSDFTFMPSMDGTVHGTGLGSLLGDINETTNTIFNMLIDAGHYASLGGGFIGSGLRLKAGGQRHRPGEWKMVGERGSDIANNIIPMTFPGPDAVLYQMLGMLIEAGKEVASVKDIMTGDTGTKNMTATTTLALIEQGMMVSNAVFKRVFKAMASEFRMLARINAETLTDEKYNAFHDGMEMYSAQDDYNLADMDITPVADPRAATKMQEAGKAQLVMQLAEMGMADKAAAATRVLEAMQIPDVEELIPQTDPAQAEAAMMMQQMQMDAAEADVVQKRADIELTLARVESERAKAMKDLTGAEAEKQRVRFEGLKMMLEEERGRLEQAIGKSRGMARAPGNGEAAQGGNGGNPSAQGGPASPMALGQGSAGIAPTDPAGVRSRPDQIF